MKNLKKSLRYSLYLLLVCVICVGCETKQDCLDRIFNEQSDKFLFYTQQYINAMNELDTETALQYGDSMHMAAYTTKIMYIEGRGANAH